MKVTPSVIILGGPYIHSIQFLEIMNLKNRFFDIVYLNHSCLDTSPLNKCFLVIKQLVFQEW
jgi:hypothetical protein